MDNICPVCGSEEYIGIGMTSSAEYFNLIYIGHGSARLVACLNCGAMYIDQFDRKSIKERLDKDKRKRRKKNEVR